MNVTSAFLLYRTYLLFGFNFYNVLTYSLINPSVTSALCTLGRCAMLFR